MVAFPLSACSGASHKAGTSIHPINHQRAQQANQRGFRGSSKGRSGIGRGQWGWSRCLHVWEGGGLWICTAFMDRGVRTWLLALAWEVGLELSTVPGDDREPPKDMGPRKLGIWGKHSTVGLNLRHMLNSETLCHLWNRAWVQIYKISTLQGKSRDQKTCKTNG